MGGGIVYRDAQTASQRVRNEHVTFDGGYFHVGYVYNVYRHSPLKDSSGCFHVNGRLHAEKLF